MTKRAWIMLVATVVVAGVGLAIHVADRGNSKSKQLGINHYKAGEVRVNPTDGAKMVYVPPGEFIMGAATGDEQPATKVKLDGYWIYEYEVTVAQYRKFCKATGREMPPAPPWGWHEDNPVVNVSWVDAEAYAKWAKVRLPTEAEWEKAARGTDGRTFPWGNKWDAQKCNNYNTGPKRTTPVGSYPSGVSPYGCHDMAGNVWEWVAFDEPPKDPFPKSPNRPYEKRARALCGGSWFNSLPERFECTDRLYYDLASRNFSRGFRCASY